MSLNAAFYGRLSSDLPLTGLLATYAAGPAVFTTDPPPGDARRPYIITAGAVTAVGFDTKDADGIDVRRDVRCYTDATGSAKRVDDIAWRVYELFHRSSLVINGRPTLWVAATPPRTGPEEPAAYARIVTVRAVTEPA